MTAMNGQTMHVTYKGGEKPVRIPPGTPIVTFEPGTFDIVVKPGAHVVVTAQDSRNGTVSATSVRAGKDGTVPPI